MIKRWWHNFLNRCFPLQCHECGHTSKDWADRRTFVGRYIWIRTGLYEGKGEEFYCGEHVELMPEAQGSTEARRRFYAGEPQ